MKHRFILFYLVLNCSLFAQNKELDSLRSFIHHAKDDTLKVQALNLYSWQLFGKGAYKDAMIYSLQSKTLASTLNDKKGLATALDHIGTLYKEQSDYNNALIHHLKALDLLESLGQKKDIAKEYNNIGLIYQYQLQYEKALSYYFKALKIAEETNVKPGIAICCNNIGLIYTEQNKYDEALIYALKAYKIKEELGNKASLAKSSGNIGLLYMKKGAYTEALKYYEKNLALAIEIGDKKGEANSYLNMGIIFTANKKDYVKAKTFMLKALTIFSELKNRDSERVTYGELSTYYSLEHDYENAYNYQVKFKKLTDSIYNFENSKQLSDLKTNYEVEKKAAELKNKAAVEQARLKAIAGEEKKRQWLIIAGVAGILLLVSLFSFFLYKRFRLTQKQKHIIEEQKELVEEKQKEILDSIAYAKRLQTAILPPEELIRKYIPENFVFYKPKDIVAGDFYWMEVVDDYLFIAAADSTGHGVPGALVSVVCSNALNRAVKEFNLRETGKILDKTRDLVIETFAKSEREVMDGMDISLLGIQLHTRQIQWSGANNPLWILINGKIVEIKADKQPIGKYEKFESFKTHILDKETGAIFYLITDGYADQFGGEKGKKFKYKQLQEILTSIESQPMDMQKQLLEKRFEDWKGNLEQVDDVTILALRI